MASGSGEAPLDGTRTELRKVAAELAAAVDEFVANPQANGTAIDQLQRRKVIDVAGRVQALVKDPADQWLDMVQGITLATSNRLFSEWGVFDAIPPEGTISYSDLAAKVDAEATLLSRIAGVLISAGVLDQDGTDAVKHTPKSRIFVSQDTAGLVYNMGWDNCLVPYASLPRYFEAYGRKEPRTTNHVPSTFAYGHPEWSLYELMYHDPVRLKKFIPAMAAVEAKMPIAGIYDFGWVVSLAQEDPTSGRPLFVDVGGGKGQAIKAISNEFPGLPRHRCVLQDRSEVIEAVIAMDEPEMRSVRKVAIDFHKEQPVKGALVYWIRRCLHNYSDEISVNILKNLVEAMADDSKVLIAEDVLDNPPNFIAAFMDFMMMSMGGKQRTLENWEKVLLDAGLKISSISSSKGPWRTMSVIECVKVSQ